MPYISKPKRKILDPVLDKVAPLVNCPGDLNYAITKLTSAFLDNYNVISRGIGGPLRYDDYNAAMGVLGCAKLELYRRMVAPYEDIKCEENGDVYDEHDNT